MKQKWLLGFGSSPGSPINFGTFYQGLDQFMENVSFWILLRRSYSTRHGNKGTVQLGGFDSTTFIHGGTLLSLKHVLTTANIFDGIDKVGHHNEVKVIPEFPGDFSIIFKEARRVPVRKVDDHSHYDPNNNHYNMFLKKLLSRSEKVGLVTWFWFHSGIT